MVGRNGISLAFLLVSVVVLLVVAPVKVESAECSCDSDGFDCIWHKIGCGLKTGVQQAKETAQDGYKFVKAKVLPKSEQPTPQNSQIDDIPREPVKLAELPQRR